MYYIARFYPELILFKYTSFIQVYIIYSSIHHLKILGGILKIKEDEIRDSVALSLLWSCKQRCNVLRNIQIILDFESDYDMETKQ